MQYAPGVLLGLFDLRFAAALDLFLQPFRLVAQFLRLLMRFLGQAALLFGDLAVVFRAGDDVLEADLVAGEVLAGLLDEKVRQAQLAGNFKGVGLARHADGEAVGGPERLHVELHGGVFHPRRGEGEGLELAVMRGGQRGHLHRKQMFENGHGQRRALGGVGARAQFVKQRQRLGRHRLQNGDDVGHVRGKGGERLLDGLLVADVGEHLVEHGQLAAVGGGDLQAGLRHQRKQPHGLQRHRLAAGVGAGDDQRGELAAHPQRGGHDLFRVDERMAGAHEVDAALLVDLRRRGTHLAGEGGAGKDHVQICQHLDVVAVEVGVRGHAVGELAEDAVDLLPLLERPLLDLVAGLHDRRRLNEQRRAAAGLIVHQPRHVLPAVGAHGDDVAPVAHGDDGVLQVLLQGRGTDDGVEPVAHAVVEGAQAAADVVEFRTGAVGHFVLGEDGVEDLLFQGPVRGQFRGDGGERARVLAVADQRVAHRARRAQALGDGQKRLHRERGADFGKLQVFGYVAEISHRRAAVVGVGGERLLRLLLQAAHFIYVARGAQRPRRGLARLGHGHGGQPFEYLGIFQYAQVSFLHRFHSPEVVRMFILPRRVTPRRGKNARWSSACRQRAQGPHPRRRGRRGRRRRSPWPARPRAGAAPSPSRRRGVRTWAAASAARC